MKVMVDLNVLLDVIQHREPHYEDSAQVVDAIVRNHIEGVVPSHSITTLYYIIDKEVSGKKSHEVVRWLLRHFDVESATHLAFSRALSLGYSDFEDGVVDVLAENANCDYIVTRNVADFLSSELSVLTPKQLLCELRFSP